MNSELRHNIEAGSMSRSPYRDNKAELYCTVVSYLPQHVSLNSKCVTVSSGWLKGIPDGPLHTLTDLKDLRDFWCDNYTLRYFNSL
jgi:hypothetical protein